MRARIQESFDSQTMMRTLGARLESIEPGCVQITAPIAAGSLQQHGAAHAALAFAIGDSAAGYSALTLMAEDQEVMTAEIKINLLAPATGDFLRATGRVIKAGRRLSVVSAEIEAITDDTAKTIAVMQGTMVPVNRPS